MAKQYDVVATNRTVDVRSPTLVEDVEEVHALTKPSGVSFVRLVPYKTWQSKGAGPALAVIAEHIEHIFAARPHVVSGAAVQLVDQSGLLKNAVEFVVEIEGATDAQPGPFRDTVTIPVQALHDLDAFDSYFDPVVKQLTAQAGL